MRFHYRAKTKDGKTETGYISAESEKEVIETIRSNGWYPVDISEKNGFFSNFGNFLNTLDNSVSLKAESLFFKQFSLLLGSGIPMDTSVKLLSEQTSDSVLRSAAEVLLKDIRSGISAADSFEKQKVFGKLEIALMRAGEEAGRLCDSLLRISEFLKKQYDLKKKVVAALIYPVLVLCVTLLVLVLMSVFVLPQFENSFKQLKIEIPRFTLFVFTFGNFIRNFWYFVPLSFFVFAAAGKYFSRYGAFNEFCDKIKLRIPLFGKVLYKASMARSCRTLGILLSAGVDMLRALKLAGETAANVKVKEIFDEFYLSAEKGKSLYNVTCRMANIPPVVGQLVKIGEETGHLSDKFLEIALLYEEDVDNMTSVLQSVLEPVLIVLVSLIVGVMLFASYLPIVSAIKNLI